MLRFTIGVVTLLASCALDHGPGDEAGARPGVPCTTAAAWCETDPAPTSHVACVLCSTDPPGGEPTAHCVPFDAARGPCPRRPDPDSVYFYCDGPEDCGEGSLCAADFTTGRFTHTHCQSLDLPLISGDTIEQSHVCQSDDDCWSGPCGPPRILGCADGSCGIPIRVCEGE